MPQKGSFLGQVSVRSIVLRCMTVYYYALMYRYCCCCCCCYYYYFPIWFIDSLDVDTSLACTSTRIFIAC